MVKMNVTQEIYSRTATGEKIAADNSGLERRSLILLRLVDGRTSVDLFEKHLCHFDVARLFSELLSAGLIARVATEAESSRLGSASHSMRRPPPLPDRWDARETRVDMSRLDRFADADMTQGFVQEESDVDHVAASFMKKYVKNVNNDDPDIKRFISDRRPIAT